MDYSTNSMQLNLEILESVLFNCHETIPKLKVKLEFEKEETLDKFKAKLNPIEDEENQVLEDENSDEENEPVREKKKIEVQSKKYIEKLSNFEEAAIIKQNYESQIDRIALETKTKILIVPEKIKYFANTYQTIEDAKDMIHELKERLSIHKIQKYGEEVYESRIIRKKLEEDKIHLTKIMEKYYFWYDKQEAMPKIVDNKVQRIFNKMYHQFYPLYPQFPNPRLSPIHLQKIVKLKGKIFKNQISRNLNEGLEQVNQLQLSISGRELLLHFQVKEQGEIYKKQLDEDFNKNLIYFFIVYDEQENQSEEEVKNIQEICGYLSRQKIIHHYENYMLVIAFEKRPIGKVDETMINDSKMNSSEGRQQEFLDQIKQIFNFNLHCVIQVLFNESFGIIQPLDEIEPQKKVTIEDKKPEQLRIFSLKNRKSDKFVDIIRQYILKPKLQKKKKQTIIPNETFSESYVTMNKIVDTSSQIKEEPSEMMEANVAINIQTDKILPEDLKESKHSSFFKKYFQKQYQKKIEDTEKDKKYTKEEFSKGKVDDDEIRELVENCTSFKFKVYKVKIPEAMKITLPENETIVTVFIKDEEKTKIYSEENVEVLLLKKYSKLKCNGWLANVPKKQVNIEEEKRLFIPPNSYEIIKYVKFVQ